MTVYARSLSGSVQESFGTMTQNYDDMLYPTTSLAICIVELYKAMRHESEPKINLQCVINIHYYTAPDSRMSISKFEGQFDQLKRTREMNKVFFSFCIFFLLINIKHKIKIKTIALTHLRI